MNEMNISPRMQEILKLMADGKTAVEIAAIQGVTYNTAVANKMRLMAKFGVYKETALIAAAFRRGVLS